MLSLTEFIKNTRDLIAAGKISLAIAALNEWTKNDADVNNSIVQFSQRYESNEKDNYLGYLYRDDYMRERARITGALLSLLTGLKPAAPPQPQEETPGKTIAQHAEKIYNINHIDNGNFS